MRTRLTPLLLCPLLIACGGPSVGEIVNQEVVLSVTAVASAPEIATIGEMEGSVAVSRLFLNAGSLTLLPCREDAEAIVLPARAYDLLESTPRERVSTAVTELCAIRLDVGPAESTPEGVPESAALYVEGSDAAGAAFAIHSETASTLLLEGVDGRSFGAVPLLLAVDVSLLLSDVSLQESDSAESVVAALPAALALYTDDNINGRLDEDERTVVAVVTPEK